jgi:hypothetical protein
MTLLLSLALIFAPQTTQTGTVSGRLLNTAGQPAVNVRVAAMAVPAFVENAVPMLSSFAMTDNTGRYKLEKIDVGTYYITAGKVDQPVYYPGGYTQATAKPVRVTAGSSITNIDFAISDAPTYKISGKLIFKPGQALPTSIRWSPAGGFGGTVAADGTFDITGLKPGTYQLGLGGILNANPTPISVVNKDVLGLEIPLPVTVPVTIDVVFDGIESRPLSPAFRFTEVGKNNPIEVFLQKRPTTLNFPEGLFRVAPRLLTGGLVLKAFTAGTTNLLEQPLKIEISQPPTLTLTVTQGSAVTFSGRVVYPAGVETRADTITLESIADVSVRYEGSIETNGTFSLQNVPPGGYLALIPGGVRIPLTVPAEGAKDQEIRIPTTRRLAVRLAGETNLDGASVRLLFTDTHGIETLLALDGPGSISLPEGEYKVSVTVRQRQGTPRINIKSLMFGTTELLNSAWNVKVDGPNEIQITLSK